MKHIQRRVTLALATTLTLAGLTGTARQSMAQADTTPGILSAYYGLHQSLPLPVEAFCHGGTGKDGMPVILSHTIDVGTLSAADFSVTSQDGQVHTPICATVAPANDLGEMRTILLVGDFGDPQSNPPVKVEIVGPLLTNGPEAVQSFKGAHLDTVTPFGAGPSLVLAESLPADQQRLGSTGRSAGCPLQGTVQVVRVTWAGGVTKPGGGEADDAVRLAYQVTLQKADGSTMTVTPFALGDLNDNDNNHHLCLDVPGTPLKVSIAAGLLVSPGKFLNPATEIAVTQAKTGRTGFETVANGCVVYYATYQADAGAAKDWCGSGQAFRWYSTLAANQQRAVSVFYTCQGDPKNPAILLIHGFPTSSFDYHALFTALTPAYYLCALDTPGYGFSDKPNDTYVYSLFDDGALVDYFVRTKLAGRSFTLLTHDKGDSVGLIYLQRYLDDHSYPAQIKAHIILNGNVYLPLAQLSTGQKALLDPTFGPITARSLTPQTFAQGIGQSVYSPALPATDSEVQALTSIFGYQSGTKVLNKTIQYLNERAKYENSWLQTLAISPIPTTIIWGAQDSIAPVAVADYIWKQDVSPRKAVGAYWQSPCANHYIQHDRPKDIAAIVTATLKGGQPQFDSSGSCTPILVAHNP